LFDPWGRTAVFWWLAGLRYEHRNATKRHAVSGVPTPQIKV
jgi:hypothetical protein